MLAILIAVASVVHLALYLLGSLRTVIYIRGAVIFTALIYMISIIAVFPDLPYAQRLDYWLPVLMSMLAAWVLVWVYGYEVIGLNNRYSGYRFYNLLVILGIILCIAAWMSLINRELIILPPLWEH